MTADVCGLQKKRTHEEENNVTVVEFAVDLAIPLRAHRNLSIPPVLNHPTVPERRQMPLEFLTNLPVVGRIRNEKADCRAPRCGGLSVQDELR